MLGNSVDITTEKAILRREFANTRPAVKDAENLKLELEKFLAHEKGVWGTYHALASEVAIDDVQAKVQKKNPQIQWAYPRVEGETLQFYIAEDFEPGPLGTRQPIPGSAKKVAVDDLDGLLIPALAFDLEGTRLGRGKGYYDKSLKKYNKKTVGIALHHQILEKLPREDHDLRVKSLVTDRGVLHFLRK